MRKVAPSVLVREELDRLLGQGAAPGNIVSELVATVTRLVVQELLEAEQTGQRHHRPAVGAVQAFCARDLSEIDVE